jgi:PAS domain S-box-containing protein
MELTHNLSDQVLQRAPAGIAIVIGADLRFHYVNPAFRMLLRIDREVAGQTVPEVFPSIKPYLLDALREVIRTGKPMRFSEAPTTFADAGQTFWNVQFVPLDSDGDGKTDAATVILDDVTDVVRTRRNLAEYEKRFRTAQEVSPAGFVILRAIRDGDGRIVDFGVVYANPAALRYNSMTQGDLGGKTFLQVLPDVARSDGVFDALVRTVETGGGCELEIRHSVEGEQRWFRSLVAKVDDGIAASFTDVTDSKLARQALEATEARLRMALEAANMGAWEHDLARRETIYSGSMTTLLGLPPRQGAAPTEWLLSTVVPEDLSIVQDTYRRALDDASDEVRVEFRVRWSDGSTRWLQSCGRFLRDSQGRPHKMVGVTFDVTDQHQLRERLEQFARMVAHDLKAPLQSATSFAALIRRLARNRLQPHEERYLERIISAVDQMDDMIDGLLDYAQATRPDLVPEPVALADAFDCAVERLEPAIRASGASVARGTLPTVRGNRTLLTQVLQNLIGNALKFRSERPLEVQVTADRRDGQWVVAVRDNGIGIPPERQGQLFDAFARAHEEHNYAGLGLGLALVKDAVAHHGGRLWVESAPSAGSTFYFSLPADDVAAASATCNQMPA